ncbi:hypothetical protein CA850_28695 [Micromonospora echinospora]|nr:hypothetical protein CA850_28695 [Micromonospora echinospora]
MQKCRTNSGMLRHDPRCRTASSVVIPLASSQSPSSVRTTFVKVRLDGRQVGHQALAVDRGDGLLGAHPGCFEPDLRHAVLLQGGLAGGSRSGADRCGDGRL